MAGSATWFEWLSGLFAERPSAPKPGTHAAILEEMRVGALLTKEASKHPGERDEALVRTLRFDYLKRELENLQVQAAGSARRAASFARPAAHECCVACGWVRQRLAAGHLAVHTYKCQRILQVQEETAAAEARRPAVILARPALHLDLPEALQQQPPRLDMCSKCAKLLQKMEMAEQWYVLQAQDLWEKFQKCGMQAAPAATASAQGAAAAAPAVAARPAEEEAQQRPWKSPGQPHCGGGSNDGGTEGSPATPKQPPLPPRQQQRASSDQEQQRASSTWSDHEQQERDAADGRHLLLPEA